MARSTHRVYCWSLSTCVALLAPSAIAQSGLPPSTIETTQSQSGQPEYTLRTRVPITILDVVVTDSKGQFVHGLKQSDFTVFEDGKEMKPNSFEEHRSDQTAPSEPIAAKQNLGSNTFTNLDAEPSNAGPLNILLLDSLNTPMAAQAMVEQHMLDYVQKLPAGTRVAVLGLSTHLFMLQGFTTDPALLRAAITDKKNLPKESPLLSLPFDASPDLARLWNLPFSHDDEVEANHISARLQATLAAMNQIALYLSGMAGRKNLLWFSGSFPLQYPPQQEEIKSGRICSEKQDCGDQKFDFTEQMKSAIDMLSRAQVAVYPIDGRGLVAVASPDRTSRKIDFTMREGEHSTMDFLAAQTGGKAFYDSNDLTAEAQRAIDDGSNYYTLTYAPTNQKEDGKYRKLHVDIGQPSLHLVYRPGYYAGDPNTTLRGQKAPRGQIVARASAMQTAMLRGALEPTQIVFKVKVEPAAGPEQAVAADNHPSASGMKPPYQRYTVTYTTDIGNIAFSTAPDGTYHGDFEFAAMVYNVEDGELLNSATKEVRPVLPATTYQTMLQSGVQAHQEIYVPVKGEYVLRLGVHDLTSDRVGAVEVPLSSVRLENVPGLATGR